MDNVYREAFAEVLEILKNSNQKIIEKIPEKFITFLTENKDNNYVVQIDFTDENWDNSIKQETQEIIALIYRDYIVSPEEREKLIAEEKEEQIRIENELRERYNPNNLFRQDDNKLDKEITTTNSLIEKRNEPWFKKIINRLLKKIKRKI